MAQSRSRLVRTVALSAGAIAAGVAIERLFLAAPRYRGPRSGHFDGSRFRNPQAGWQTEGSFLKWQATRTSGLWRTWVDVPFGPPPPARVDGGRLRATYINHATTLIQMDGLNILTDPVWSERVSPVSFAGPKRHRPPGLRFDDLPPIDVVLLSHNHYDHLDLATLWRLARRHRPRIYTMLGNSLLLSRHRLGGAMELDWWDSAPLSDRVALTAVPSQHFSARGLSDRNATLWGGFVISGPSGNVYFAGDTGWGAHFARIGERFDPIRLALLPIGAYLPRWFMSPAHIEPAEAVKAHLALRASTSVAIHFGTFRLADDGELQPVEDLQRAVATNGDPRFWVLDFGEGREIP